VESVQETEEEKQERRLKEGIGIPHIIIDCTDNSRTAFIRAAEAGKLPSAEEVIFSALSLGSSCYIYINDCYWEQVSLIEFVTVTSNPWLNIYLSLPPF